MWADYLCNASVPYSYSGTVHHPEHFSHVPGVGVGVGVGVGGSSMGGHGGVATHKAEGGKTNHKRPSNDEEHVINGLGKYIPTNTANRRIVKRQKLKQISDSCTNNKMATLKTESVHHQQQHATYDNASMEVDDE